MFLFIPVAFSLLLSVVSTDPHELAKELLDGINNAIVKKDEHALAKYFHHTFNFKDCFTRINRTDYIQFLLAEGETHIEPFWEEQTLSGYKFATQLPHFNEYIYYQILHVGNESMTHEISHQLIFGKVYIQPLCSA